MCVCVCVRVCVCVCYSYIISLRGYVLVTRWLLAFHLIDMCNRAVRRVCTSIKCIEKRVGMV